NDTINGQAGNDTIDGGTGDDIVNGGTGDDIIHWTAPEGGSGGWDVVDGGSEGIGGDTFVITGNSSYEIFRFYPAEDATTLYPDLVLKGAATEIVVTRTLVVNGVETTTEVIAELTEIEEIVINGTSASGVGEAGGDRFELIGDFAEQGEETSLRTSTITIVGTDGDDTVDISKLASAHRIVFKTKGGNDTIIGTLRPQDVVQLPNATTIDDYDMVRNVNGSTTLVGEGHSLTFFSNGGLPQFVSEGDGTVPGDFIPPATGDQNEEDEDDDNDNGGVPDGNDDEDDDDDDQAGGTEDDDDASGVLIGTVNGEAIVGGNGRDMIFAGDGADNALGGGGNDMIYGDAGNDRLF